MPNELNLPLPEPRRPHDEDRPRDRERHDPPRRSIDPPGTGERSPGAGGFDRRPSVPVGQQVYGQQSHASRA